MTRRHAAGRERNNCPRNIWQAWTFRKRNIWQLLYSYISCDLTMQQDTAIQQRQQQHEYMMYIVYTSLAHKAVATENLKPIEMEETKKKTTPRDKGLVHHSLSQSSPPSWSTAELSTRDRSRGGSSIWPVQHVTGICVYILRYRVHGGPDQPSLFQCTRLI
jgi:hypothetical protein